MTALTTILIWLGSGFAFAAGFGFGVWFLVRNQDKGLAKQTLEVLKERNVIGFQQAEQLKRIADIAEEMRNLYAP